MLTWIFRLGMVLVNVGGIFSGDGWYGKILGLVEKEKAKRIWIGGMALIPLGLILIFMPVALGALPETGVQKEAEKVWFPLFWVAIAILLVGGLPFAIFTQAKFLEMVKLETAQKVFKISLIIMSIGMGMLLYVLMPGHLLPPSP